MRAWDMRALWSVFWRVCSVERSQPGAVTLGKARASAASQPSPGKVRNCSWPWPCCSSPDLYFHWKKSLPQLLISFSSGFLPFCRHLCFCWQIRWWNFALLFCSEINKVHSCCKWTECTFTIPCLHLKSSEIIFITGWVFLLLHFTDFLKPWY